MMSAILALTVIVTSFWKISAHGIGMGALTVFLIVLNSITPTDELFALVILSIISCGLVISSRYFLNAHTQSQLYVGYLAGVICGGVGSFLIL